MNKTTMEAAVEWVRWASLIPGGPDIEFAEKFAAVVQDEANKGRLATDTQTDREPSVGEASSAPLLPTPPDAEAVARLDVMLAVTACEQSVSESFTQEDYNRDRASLEAALDAYRAAIAEAVERRVRAESPVVLVGWVALDATGERMADELFVSQEVALREWPTANAVPVFRAAQDHLKGGPDDGQ